MAYSVYAAQRSGAHDGHAAPEALDLDHRGRAHGAPSMIPSARDLSPTSAHAVAAATAAATAYARASTSVNHFIPQPPQLAATSVAHQRHRNETSFVHPRDREFMAETERAITPIGGDASSMRPGGRCARWHFLISNSLLLVTSLVLLIFALSVLPGGVAPNDTISLSSASPGTVSSISTLHGAASALSVAFHNPHARALKALVASGGDNDARPSTEADSVVSLPHARPRSAHAVAASARAAFDEYKKNLGVPLATSSHEIDTHSPSSSLLAAPGAMPHAVSLSSLPDAAAATTAPASSAPVPLSDVEAQHRASFDALRTKLGLPSMALVSSVSAASIIGGTRAPTAVTLATIPPASNMYAPPRHSSASFDSLREQLKLPADHPLAAHAAAAAAAGLMHKRVDAPVARNLRHNSEAITSTRASSHTTVALPRSTRDEAIQRPRVDSDAPHQFDGSVSVAQVDHAPSADLPMHRRPQDASRNDILGLNALDSSARADARSVGRQQTRRPGDGTIDHVDDIDALMDKVHTHLATGPTVDPTINKEHFQRDAKSTHFLHADALLDGEPLHTLLPDQSRTHHAQPDAHRGHEGKRDGMDAQLEALNREAKHLLGNSKHTNHDDDDQRRRRRDNAASDNSDASSSASSLIALTARTQHNRVPPVARRLLPATLALLAAALAAIALASLSVVAFFRLRLHRRFVSLCCGCGGGGEVKDCPGARLHYALVVTGVAALTSSIVALSVYFEPLCAYVDAIWAAQHAAAEWSADGAVASRTHAHLLGRVFDSVERNTALMLLVAELVAALYCVYGNLFSSLAVHALDGRESHRDDRGVGDTFGVHPGGIDIGGHGSDLAAALGDGHVDVASVVPAHLRSAMLLVCVCGVIAMCTNVWVLYEASSDDRATADSDQALGDQRLGTDRWPFRLEIGAACASVIVAAFGVAVSLLSPSSKDKSPYLLALYGRALLLSAVLCVTASLAGVVYAHFFEHHSSAASVSASMSGGTDGDSLASADTALAASALLVATRNANALFAAFFALAFAHALAAYHTWLEYCELVCQFVAVSSHKAVLHASNAL